MSESTPAAPVLLEPKPATLKKYGLSLEEWYLMADDQGFKCYICRTIPPSSKLHIDHLHVRGWKKLPPEKRKLYVRGLLCFTCNAHVVGRHLTIDKAKRAVSYLERFAQGEATSFQVD